MPCLLSFSLFSPGQRCHFSLQETQQHSGPVPVDYKIRAVWRRTIFVNITSGLGQAPEIGPSIFQGMWSFCSSLTIHPECFILHSFIRISAQAASGDGSFCDVDTFPLGNQQLSTHRPVGGHQGVTTVWLGLELASGSIAPLQIPWGIQPHYQYFQCVSV